MPEINLAEWNRSVVEETIKELEKSEAAIADAKSRLRGFLAVNPGGPVVPPASGLAIPTLESRKPEIGYEQYKADCLAGG